MYYFLVKSYGKYEICEQTVQEYDHNPSLYKHALAMSRDKESIEEMITYLKGE